MECPWTLCGIPWTLHGILFFSFIYSTLSPGTNSVEFYGIPWCVHGIPRKVHGLHMEYGLGKISKVHKFISD